MRMFFRSEFFVFVLLLHFAAPDAARADSVVVEEGLVGFWSSDRSCDEGLIFGSNGISAGFDDGGESIVDVVEYSVDAGNLQWHHPYNPMSADIVHAGPEYLALAIAGRSGGNKKVRVFQRCFNDRPKREAERKGVEFPASVLKPRKVSKAVAIAPRVGVWTDTNGACGLPEDGALIMVYGADGDWVWLRYDQDTGMYGATYGGGEFDGYQQSVEAEFWVEFDEASAVRKGADEDEGPVVYATFPGQLDGQPVLIDVEISEPDEVYVYHQCSNISTWKEILNARLDIDINIEGGSGLGLVSVWQERFSEWWSSSSETIVTTTTTLPGYSVLEGTWGVVADGSGGAPLCASGRTLEISVRESALYIEAARDAKRFSRVKAISGGWTLYLDGKEFGNIVRSGTDQFSLEVTDYSQFGIKKGDLPEMPELEEKMRRLATTQYGRCG